MHPYYPTSWCGSHLIPFRITCVLPILIGIKICLNDTSLNWQVRPTQRKTDDYVQIDRQGKPLQSIHRVEIGRRSSHPVVYQYRTK